MNISIYHEIFLLGLQTNVYFSFRNMLANNINSVSFTKVNIVNLFLTLHISYMMIVLFYPEYRMKAKTDVVLTYWYRNTISFCKTKCIIRAVSRFTYTRLYFFFVDGCLKMFVRMIINV